MYFLAGYPRHTKNIKLSSNKDSKSASVWLPYIGISKGHITQEVSAISMTHSTKLKVPIGFQAEITATRTKQTKNGPFQDCRISSEKGNQVVQGQVVQTSVGTWQQYILIDCTEKTKGRGFRLLYKCKYLSI